MTKLYWTDRYGGVYPRNACKGKCEGMGVYPKMSAMRRAGMTIDKVPFVKCPRCNGTGKEPQKRRAR